MTYNKHGFDSHLCITRGCAIRSVVVNSNICLTVAVLMLQCIIIRIMYQCCLCTIRISSVKYVRGLWSHFITLFLTLRKALPGVPCYLWQDIHTVHIFFPLSVPLSGNSPAWILVLTSHMEPHIGFLNIQTHSAAEQRAVASPEGTTVFNRPVSQKKRQHP